MKRLRHPIRALREPFGTAGLIVALVALVAALGGTAFAAAKLNSTQKKEVEQIAKKSGKPGPEGKQGPAGPAGAAGSAGAKGEKGDTGEKGNPGDKGASGDAGNSVVVVNEEPENCHNEEGVTYEVESSNVENEVCNGEPGAIHPGETLPSGASETGSWSMNVGAIGDAPISFTVPLHADLALNHFEYIAEGHSGGADCTGGTVAKPKANPGYLCVYTASGAVEQPITFGPINPNASLEFGVGTTGAILTAENVEDPTEFLGIAYGSWAVTAP